jgi:ABC-type dipeptide/oligopeptide/nickel transport system permease subunit
MSDNSNVQENAPVSLSYWQDVRKRFFANKLSIVGLGILVFLILVGIFGPIISKFKPDELSSDILVSPGTNGHWLGTDDLGRDIFERATNGIRLSMTVAIVVTIISVLVGVTLGGLAGYFGGWVDTIISRFIDTWQVIPFVLIGFAIITVFGSSFWVIVAALVLTGWYSTTRLFRASVMQVKSLEYVEAARATGATTKRIILRHIGPNAIPPIIVVLAFSVAGAILSESIYAFLGVGFREPTPSLGVMISSSRNYLTDKPFVFFIPGSILVALTLSIVLIGDGLRDALDPKLRGSK